jgi:hypothetical protein
MWTALLSHKMKENGIEWSSPAQQASHHVGEATWYDYIYASKALKKYINEIEQKR